MQPLKYKLVRDHKGVIECLELWQGNQHIKVSFGAESSFKNGYRWLEVKETVDEFQEQAHKEVTAALGEGMEWLVDGLKNKAEDGKMEKK